MKIKLIPNSPGYYITDTGEVYNNDKKRMKTWFSTDGYERIRLPSLQHKKNVNRTVHLLVAEAFLNGGMYTNNKLQVNHIDGVKSNNNVTNLELVTQTENVVHAHNNNLYTYNLVVTLYDILLDKHKRFRSLRELSRYLKVSLNFLKPRIIISNVYPINNRYKLDIDYKNYIQHISTIKNTKHIHVYSHITGIKYYLTSYSQIGILFGISDIKIGKKLHKDKEASLYVGGYTFSLKEITNPAVISKDTAKLDRDILWKKLGTNVIT